MKPFVSCICPARPITRYQYILEEAIESFLRQDYDGPRELIVLADCPGQTLVCDAPGVKVFNLPERYPTLGDKYNAAIHLSIGGILLPWEDDDISLPHRISQAVAVLGHMEIQEGDPSPEGWRRFNDRWQADYAYFNPQRSWFWAQFPAGPEGSGLHWQHSHGVCHNASAFTREAFNRVGGYAKISGAQDAYMDTALKRLDTTAPPLSNDPAEWTYIYCWGRTDSHVSGNSDHEAFYRGWGQKQFPQGTFTLRPHWTRDYIGLCAYAAELAKAGRKQ